MLPTAAVKFAVAPPSGRVAQQSGPRIVLLVGALVSFAGYALAVLTIAWTTLIGAAWASVMRRCRC